MSNVALIPLPDEPERKPLKVLGIADLLTMPLAPREMVLSPILPVGGLAMLYAPRGIGKTHLALSIAYAVASGTSFLRWHAPKPRTVLYIDGEMPLATLKERLAAIIEGTATEPPSQEFFRLLAADHHEDGLPNIGDVEDQKQLLPVMDGVSLVILDNLSTLASHVRENEADDWQPIQALLLRLRRMRVAVLLVHHAGRNGQARGTSRREDVLDTVISLKRPEDYDPGEGARFEVHFEKARGIFGPEAEPFEARLFLQPGAPATWTLSEIASNEKADAFEMFATGATVKDVMTALAVSKATAYRWQKQYKAGG